MLLSHLRSARHVQPPEHHSLRTDTYLHTETRPAVSKSHPCTYKQIERYAAMQPPHPITPQTHTGESYHMSHLVRFMACKEIIITGLLQLDDCPEMYRAWKSSFLIANRDLNLTMKEKMDLLVKWLGADSREQVKRLRAVHINNPDKSLQRIWESLDEDFGAPEVIES